MVNQPEMTEMRDDFLFVIYFRQVNLLLSEAIEALISFLVPEYFRHEAVSSTQMTTSVQEIANQFENWNNSKL